MTANTRFRPDYSHGRPYEVSSSSPGDILIEAAKLMRQDYQTGLDRVERGYEAEQKRKQYEAELGFKTRAEAREIDQINRKLNEQKAVDVYNTERAKGVQNIGGIYGDRLAQAAGQYYLTPAEIEWTKANGVDANAARKVGNDALAKKLDWQTNVSNNVEPFLQSGAGNESRVDMYERINKSVLDKGLTPTSEMINSLDAARLAEIEAKKTRDKMLQEQQDTANKSNVDIMKWAIGQQGGGSGVPTYDTEGNVTGYTGTAAAKRATNVDDKYDVSKAKGERDILEYINKNKAGDKGTARVDSVKLYKEILASDPTIDPESAAAAVTAGVGIDKGAWYNPWSEDKTSYKPTAAQDLVPLLKGTRTPESVGSTINVGGQSNKGILAEELAKQVTNSNKATLDKSAVSRSELLKSDREVTNDKVDAWLQSRGLTDKPIVTSKSIDNITDITKDFATKTRDSESSNNYSAVNKKSGALGAYQFLPSTLDYLRRKTGDKFTDEEFLSNPKLQDRYFDILTKSNAGRLEALGIAPTEQNLYAAHNLGPGNVKKLLEGSNDGRVGGALKANSLDSAEAWFERNKKFSADKSGFISDEAKGSDNLVKKALVPTRETAVGKEATPLKEIVTKSGDTLDTKAATNFASKVAEVYNSDEQLNNPMSKIARATAGYFGGNDLGGNTQYGSGVLMSKSKANVAKLAREYGIETQKDMQAVINEVDPNDTQTLDALKHMQYYLRYDNDIDFRKKEQLGEAASVVGNTFGQALGFGRLESAINKGKVPGTDVVTLGSSTTISGGSRKAILEGQYIPRIQELVTRPLTQEVREELLSIAKKMPGKTREGIINYIQRAEK